ncbi:hypothetical protein [Methylobacter psychrophilus]|uniref:hypothetical protein n=1 Tax=Methylobacter psychrophilus TaxID=96941 RepID=UPI0021D50594|nr:hypothetical protein [Methylobacter psychrophilus]
MNNLNDNRIPRDVIAITKIKMAIRENNKSSKKWENSHENCPKNRREKTRSIQRGIRDVKDLALAEYQGGLVYRFNTPSHDIENLVKHLPESVFIYAKEDDKDTGIKLKFSAWKNLDKDLKPYFYQLALSELESSSNNNYRLTPFVFNESKALTAAFKQQKLLRVDFIRDRLQKALSEALKRPKDNKVAFWFAFETAGRGQPHYQGAFLIRQDEEDAVQKAIYKLNGKMTAREKHGCYRNRFNKRVKVSQERSALFTDLNWADYNLKEIGLTKMEYNGLNKIVAATQPLIKHTEDYYNRFLQQYKVSKY